MVQTFIQAPTAGVLNRAVTVMGIEYSRILHLAEGVTCARSHNNHKSY